MTETMAQLVRDYNRLNPKKRVTRFSSKAAGVKALAALRLIAAASVPGATFADLPVSKPRNRSLATAASWKNKAVAKARALRTPVVVQGHGEFASTSKAFRALNLPRTNHIRFRMALKRDGIRTFTHQGVAYVFQVVNKKETAA